MAWRAYWSAKCDICKEVESEHVEHTKVFGKGIQSFNGWLQGYRQGWGACAHHACPKCISAGSLPDWWLNEPER